MVEPCWLEITLWSLPEITARLLAGDHAHDGCLPLTTARLLSRSQPGCFPEIMGWCLPGDHGLVLAGDHGQVLLGLEVASMGRAEEELRPVVGLMRRGHVAPSSTASGAAASPPTPPASPSSSASGTTVSPATSTASPSSPSSGDALPPAPPPPPPAKGPLTRARAGIRRPSTRYPADEYVCTASTSAPSSSTPSPLPASARAALRDPQWFAAIQDEDRKSVV